jgi:hypothetical protein
MSSIRRAMPGLSKSLSARLGGKPVAAGAEGAPRLQVRERYAPGRHSVEFLKQVFCQDCQVVRIRINLLRFDRNPVLRKSDFDLC